MTFPTPSQEVKKIIQDWVKLNEEKYGPHWKAIVAKEMTAAIPDDVKKFFADRLNTPQK